MFIRAVQSRDRKTGHVYTFHQLVESHRTEQGPRQRVILHLGTLDLPREHWRALAAALEERLSGQKSLFQAETQVESLANTLFDQYNLNESLRHAREERASQSEFVQVDLASLSSSLHRSLGPELVGHTFYQRLGFPEILATCGFSVYQLQLAEAVILGRLIDPGSDLWTWRWLRKHTSLPEFTSLDLEKTGKDAIYEITDRLWLSKDALEAGLREREGGLFPCEESIFLYDLTNTYLEGNAHGNGLAKRGHSKEKRSDCPLVTLALAVDSQGFPLLSQIYEGNQSEPETLAQVLMKLQTDGAGLFKGQKPTLIMDRGIATSDNLKLMSSEGYPYLVIERRDETKDFETEFTQAPEGFERVSGEVDGERVYIRKEEASLEEHGRALVRLLCYSEGKALKERGMDQLKEKRFLEDVASLQRRVEKGALRDAPKVHIRIGRLKERYPSIAKSYKISCTVSPDTKKVLALTCERAPLMKSRETRQGCYVIRTTHVELEPAAIWKLYMTLTRVESAFRALKSHLGFRPIRHHGEDRTRAHLFISLLAYHLLASIERSLRLKGDTRTWETLQEELSTHQRSTISLRGTGKKTYQIRISSDPEKHQTEIYRLLDIPDPLPRRRRTLTLRS